MRKNAIMVLASVLAVACSSGSAPEGASVKPVAGPASGPPAPNAAHPPCIFSADCPAGAHCDLEQCVQDCNTADPCTGPLTCTPRARCNAPNVPDTDPAPTAEYVGALSVSPQTVVLTDRVSSFDVALTSSGTAPVRYRVALDGPHLAIAEAQGTFTGSTQLTLQVQSSGLQGRNIPGTVHIITSVGDADVAAPIHVGVTGSYKGTLIYDGGPVNLGQTHFAVDVLESGGDAQLRVVSHDSMLFPVVDNEETTGHGSYTVSGGLDATVAQVIDASFGGARNHFGRPIGRQVRLQLQPAATSSALAGTFSETVVGLFAEPITTTGHVSLQYVPQDGDPTFMVAADPAMPPSPSQTEEWRLTDIFPWTANATCADFATGRGWGTTIPLATGLATIESGWGQALGQSFQALHVGTGTESTLYPDSVAACEASLQAETPAQYTAGTGSSCGFVAGIACGLQLATTITSTDPTVAPLAGALFQETLAPGLLIAKNSIVQALTDSFIGGLSQEQTDYAAASDALTPFARWVTQPAVLEYLRSMPPDLARGPAPTSVQNQVQPYPAARSLADLFLTESTIDGESARVAASSGSSATDVLATAQTNALLAYLEAVTLGEILRSWGSTTASIASKSTGLLTPLDRGYAALLDGGNILGVPAGFVPFVYRPEDAAKGATNFEQMLLVAVPFVAQEGMFESQFTANNRTYEAQQQQIATEIENVREQFVNRLQSDCGGDFDPSAITSTNGDWSSCGATGGLVAEGKQQIQQANAQLASAQARITNAQKRIDIDDGLAATTQGIDQGQITFTQNNGQSIAANAFQGGLLSAVQQSMAVASNASIENFGAPVAEAAAVFAIGLGQASLAEGRANLETAQQVETEQGQSDRDQANDTSLVQKDTIDLGQAGTDVQQQAIGVTQAQLGVVDKINDAKQTWEDLQRQLDLIAHDPTRDPSYRILRDSLSQQVIDARTSAQFYLSLALSALAYEINMPIDPSPVLRAQSQTSLNSLATCMANIFSTWRIVYGSAQQYNNTVSVRALLGITGPRTDPVTGETLSEGDQFRRFLLANENLDGKGGVGVKFATDLQPGNGLWSADVCDDRIANVQAELVGDFLGDNEAQVNLSLGGDGVMRTCDLSGMQTWSFGGSKPQDAPRVAVIQAGVNSFGDAPAPNTSLYGQPVARATWLLTVPGALDAPSNADVDITHIDDIVLKIVHTALPGQSSPLSLDLSCLSLGSTP